MEAQTDETLQKIADAEWARVLAELRACGMKIEEGYDRLPPRHAKYAIGMDRVACESDVRSTVDLFGKSVVRDFGDLGDGVLLVRRAPFVATLAGKTMIGARVGFRLKGEDDDTKEAA